MNSGQMLDYINRFKRIRMIENKDKRLQELDRLQREFEENAKMPVFNSKLLAKFREENPELFSFRENIVMHRMEEMNSRC